jgi:hypothetical protein
MALAACVLWLAGVEALPAVHEALHGGLADHRHDSGSIVVTSFEDTTHRHPDGTIHVVTPSPRARKAVPEGESRVLDRTARVDGAHADGLAHHAAALAPAAPPVTHPLPIDRRPITLAVEHAIELVTEDPLAPSARGPPIA